MAGRGPSFTVLNGEALFAGDDANGQVGLWVTNGTAAGTHELNVSGASTGAVGGSGAHLEGLTVFNNEVLFWGTNASGIEGLWVTDGTAAGTHGLISRGPTRFDHETFTVFNGEVLFGALDTNNQHGLWVTNGTAAGTHELTGISGAYAGAGGLAPSGGNPQVDGAGLNGPMASQTGHCTSKSRCGSSTILILSATTSSKCSA